MKKQLFLGSALLAAIGAFAQTPAGKINGGIREVLNNKYVINENLTSVQENPAVHTVQGKRSASAVDANWSLISQSTNFFGVLVPDSKPLYYNHELDAVSFIQRVSAHYTPNPVPSVDAKTGVMIAMISANWGAKWDSTCIYNNDQILSRYPQGGIFNPPGNTQLSNAYVVAMGPGTTPPPQLWIGNWFASKKLDVYNNVADVTDTLSQQFIKSIPVDSVVGKVDFCRQDFTITDDGKVRSLGGIYNEVNPSFSGFRGGRIVKGQFTSGHFVWTSDSISLKKTPTSFDSITGEYNAQLDLVNMAWSQSGTTGYVWFIGARTGATGSNDGFHPIVWKTTDGGNFWSLLPGIDFNDTTGKYDVVMNTIDTLKHARKPGQTAPVRVPMFNYLEDISGVVDANNELHLVSSIWTMRDSTGAILQYTNTAGDGQVYRYRHTPGREAYIYDFTTKGADWKVMVVDSMRTEAPTAVSTGIGYQYNPWAVYETSKQNSNARIQVSRTPDGQFIVYTWAESNTDITDAGRRWNNKPDIHVRMLKVGDTIPLEDEFDISGSANEANVQAAAFMHNTSPICKVTPQSYVYDLKLPVKVSNSTLLKPELDANHYYTTAELSFTRRDVGINENVILASNSSLYPNPAQNSAILKLELNKNSKVLVTVMNTVGQVLTTSTTEAVVGTNEINVNISGLATGIYMVNVKADGATVTKKLIVK